MQKLSPPQLLEKKILKYAPNLFNAIADIRADPPDYWPDWCYIPMAATYAVLTQGASVDDAQAVMENVGIEKLGEATAVAIWHVSKVCYKFDETLAKELMAQEIDAIPCEILKHMPQYCVCILDPPACSAVALYLWLEYDYRYTGSVELRMTYQFDDNVTRGFGIDVSDDSTFAEATNKIFGHYDIGDLLEAMANEAYALDAEHDIDKRVASQHLNLLLYLCADNTETESKSRPKPCPTPRTPKEPEPRKEQRQSQIEVGYRIGATLRKAEADNETASKRESRGHASPVAHMRRGHFAHYWVGTGRTELAVRWLAPMLVGGKDPDDIEPTIHPVKE